MNLSAQMTIVISAIFSSICYGVALKGFSAIGEMTDAVQIADANGFAWFWAFLGSIAVAMGVVSWWLLRTQKEGDDD